MPRGIDKTIVVLCAALVSLCPGSCPRVPNDSLRALAGIIRRQRKMVAGN
jgi:hypothetical protein